MLAFLFEWLTKFIGLFLVLKAQIAEQFKDFVMQNPNEISQSIVVFQ